MNKQQVYDPIRDLLGSSVSMPLYHAVEPYDGHRAVNQLISTAPEMKYWRGGGMSATQEAAELLFGGER